MNKCDLEELRHQAMQQILEAAQNSPEKWEKRLTGRTFLAVEVYTFGNYKLCRTYASSATFVDAFFAGESIESAACFDFTGGYKEFKETPCAKAVAAIEKHRAEREREAACQRLATKMGLNVAPPEEKLNLDPPYTINNGYDPEPNNLWKKLVSRLKGLDSR